MSHTSEIDVRIVDVDALRAAITELQATVPGLKLEVGGVPRAYFARQEGMGAADFVIRIPTAKYDVGVYKASDGRGYVLRTDFFGGSVSAALGSANATTEQAKLGKLYQMYAVHATSREAARQGRSVQRMQQADGSIRLIVSGG